VCECCHDKEGAAPAVLRWTDGPAYLPLLTGSPQTCGMRCGRVDLKSGEEVGAHNTGAHEETLVIVEGAGVAELAATPTRIEAGQVLYVPPETPHNIRNVDSPRLRYLFIVAPVASAARPSAP